MKLDPTNTTRKAGAFTLIEMIGVLAVIAILAAVLIPKVFKAINDARISTVAMGASTVKTAVIDHYAKYGAFDKAAPGITVTIPQSGYDTNVLMVEQLMDKPFLPRVGTNAYVVVSTCAAAGDTVDGTKSAYNLSGNAANTNEAYGLHIVEAVVAGVAQADAAEISARIDGPTMSLTTAGADIRGRVIYAAGEPTTVRIYLTHR